MPALLLNTGYEGPRVAKFLGSKTYMLRKSIYGDERPSELSVGDVKVYGRNMNISDSVNPLASFVLVRGGVSISMDGIICVEAKTVDRLKDFLGRLTTSDKRFYMRVPSTGIHGAIRRIKDSFSKEQAREALKIINSETYKKDIAEAKKSKNQYKFDKVIHRLLKSPKRQSKSLNMRMTPYVYAELPDVNTDSIPVNYKGVFVINKLTGEEVPTVATSLDGYVTAHGLSKYLHTSLKEAKSILEKHGGRLPASLAYRLYLSKLNGVFERGACGVTSDNVRFARLSEVAVILNVSKNKCEKLLQSEGWNWCVTSVAKGAPVLVDMEDVRKYAVKSKDAALVRLVSGWLTGDTKTRKALLEDAKHRNSLAKKSSGNPKPVKAKTAKHKTVESKTTKSKTAKAKQAKAQRA